MNVKDCPQVSSHHGCIGYSVGGTVNSYEAHEAQNGATLESESTRIIRGLSIGSNYFRATTTLRKLKYQRLSTTIIHTNLLHFPALPGGLHHTLISLH